ncbi:MAG: helix-turn-helix domain-containing protein [Oscillospiraceae bacterium]|nr:helix-turn-helix domain-containing protein [Oscillospiraceae bacterium]
MTTQELFNSSRVRSKEALLQKIEDLRLSARQRSGRDSFRPASYYARLDEMFLELKEKVEKKHLFLTLEDWWCYAVRIGSAGMKVTLDYYSDVKILPSGEMVSAKTESGFEVAAVAARELTVEEYADLFRVDHATVRQWIRRGKIRTAVKAGTDWRIPELTSPPRRGYTPGCYRWEEPLAGVPEGFEMLTAPAAVYIGQKERKGDGFFMEVSRNGRPEVFDLSHAQRAVLECWLIGNPSVRCTTEGYTEYL